MKMNPCSKIRRTAIIFSMLLSIPLLGSAPAEAKGPGAGGGGGNGGETGETAGNNLSYPVIWAEGIAKTLPGTPGMTPVLAGEFWYQWGTTGVDPNVVPLSCPPDPDETNLVLNPDGDNYCDNSMPNSLTDKAGPATDVPLAKAYLQKDAKNTWQAGTANPTVDPVTGEPLPSDKIAPVHVDFIDWGDSIESVDWYTRSQVRIEVVLTNLVQPMTEYEMRHISGWGTDEVHGLATTPKAPQEVFLGPGTEATIYSPCARLTIQKLLVSRDDPSTSSLVWDAENTEWTEEPPDPTETTEPIDIINEPFFDKAVHEASDGPGYFNAEINVKGKIIYGYTWNVRQENDMIDGTPAGDYRITFSMDKECPAPTVLRNTVMDETTRIIVPLEEEIIAAALTVETTSTDGGGAVAQLDLDNQLTYVDVHIIERTGGGGGRR